MFVDMLLFMWLAYRYTPLGVVNYAELEAAEAAGVADASAPVLLSDEATTTEHKKRLSGIDNAAFSKQSEQQH